MGMEASRKATRPSRVTIETAKNGGHIVEHYFDNSGAGESYRQNERHVFSDHASMIAHVHKHTMTDMHEGNVTAPTGVGRPATAKAPGPRTFGAGVD